MAYQVFLSSTGKDLADYRDAAEEAINRLDGFTVDRMENWGARDNCPEEFDQERIEEADLVVFIVGHNYGSSPPKKEKSYTELEYEAALSGRGRLFFIANDEFALPVNLRERDQLHKRQIQFRARILDEDPPPIAQFFGPDVSKFGMLVGTAVSNWRPKSERKSPAKNENGHRGMFNVPRRPDLIGREGMVGQLHDMLQGDGKTAIVPALAGQGGIGKTQLAALYANEHKDDYRGGIFWLNMATPTAESLLSQLGYFGRQVADRQFETEQHSAEAFLGAIGNDERALVVLDNLERSDLLTGSLPGLPAHRLDTLRCRMLVTTRQRKLAGCQSLFIELLPRSDAEALLKRETGRSFNGEKAEFASVIRRLGGLPLALRIGGNLLKEQGWSYEKFDQHLEQHGIDALDWDEANPPDYEKTLPILLEEQWQSLPAEHQRPLYDILQTLGLLPESASVRTEFLRSIGVPGLSLRNPALDALEQAIKKLHGHNLVERPEDDTVRLHPLVHDFAKRRAEADDTFEKGLFERADKALSTAAWLAVQTSADLLTLAQDCRPLVQRRAANETFTRQLQRSVDAQSHALRRGFPLWAQLHVSATCRGDRSLMDVSQSALRQSSIEYGEVRWTTSIENDHLLRRLEGHSGWVRGCALSSDGKTGLSASYDQTLIVWDIESGVERRRLEGHSGFVSGCALSSDGKTGLSASSDRTLIVWDIESGVERRRLEGHSDLVSGCALSSDGKTGLSASSDQTLIVWDIESGVERRRLEGHSDLVSGCALSSDGKTGLSASEDQTLIVWDIESGVERRRLEGHSGWVRGCALSSDGKTGLSASEDQTLIVWDIESGVERRRLEGHNGEVNSCALSSDGKTGLSASSDRTLIVWDIESGVERRRLEGHSGWVRGCALSSDGKTGLSASEDQTLIVWDIESGVERRRLEGHNGEVNSCALSGDGKTGLSASYDQTLIVWDIESGVERRRLEGHSSWVRGCALSSDGKTGLSASEDQTLIVWDIESGVERRRLEGHNGWVRGCALSSDGKTGLSASYDQTLIVWDIESGVERRRLEGHSSWVRGCALSSDGKTGLSASEDQTLIVWDIESGVERRRLEGHSSWVRGCALSSDGKTGLSASEDQTLIVWDIESGVERRRLEGHSDLVSGCALSSDGKTGLSVSRDGTLIVWDIESGVELVRLLIGPLRSCALSDDRQGVLVGDASGDVWCFDLVLPGR